MRRGIRTVQRLRELREREALVALAGAEREVRAREETLARRRAAHASRSTHRGARAADLSLDRLVGIASHEQVEAAGADLAASQVQREVANEARVTASIRRRSLDRLVERIGERETAAAQAAAQRHADELALLTFGGRP